MLDIVFLKIFNSYNRLFHRITGVARSCYYVNLAVDVSCMVSEDINVGCKAFYLKIYKMWLSSKYTGYDFIA